MKTAIKLLEKEKRGLIKTLNNGDIKGMGELYLSEVQADIADKIKEIDQALLVLSNVSGSLSLAHEAGDLIKRNEELENVIRKIKSLETSTSHSHDDWIEEVLKLVNDCYG